jgi:hypothetical protein
MLYRICIEWIPDRKVWIWVEAVTVGRRSGCGAARTPFPRYERCWQLSGLCEFVLFGVVDALPFVMKLQAAQK